MREVRGRLLEMRVCKCGCGVTFAVTCQNRSQLCASRECVSLVRKRSTAAMRVRTTYTLRQSRFGAEIARMVEAGKVAHGDLLALCADVYRRAYQAGFMRGRQKRAEARELRRRQITKGRAA